MGRLEIKLLGPFQASLDGVTLSGFDSDKVRALLAYLAVEADQPHRRERLAGLLWPEWSERSARTNLRSALANLRKVIGDHDAQPPFLRITRQTIQFNQSSDSWLDVLEFKTTLQVQAGPAPGVEQWERAIRLYRGSFLEGFSIPDSLSFEEWALVNREAFQMQFSRALQRLGGYYEGIGAYDQALRYARQLVAMDSYLEQGHRQVMRVLARCGQRNEALAQYELCRQILAGDLGVEPQAETNQIYQLIKENRDLPAFEDHFEIAPVRLPGFLEEEIPDEPSAVFVARERQLEQLNIFLDKALDHHGQVAFVVGEAGSGKTSLVNMFTRCAQESHPDLLVAVGNCNAHVGIGDAYLPFREIIAMLTGEIETKWALGAVSRCGAQRLWETIPQAVELLLENGYDLLDIFVPSVELLARVKTSGYPDNDWMIRLEFLAKNGRASNGELEQALIFEQYAKFLISLSAQKPLILVLDDLQWVDSSSIGLLSYLQRRIANSRVLIIGAYRPDEIALGRAGKDHPIEKMLVEFKRYYGDIWVDLEEAQVDEGRAFVEAFLDSEPNRLGSEFREALFAYTGGHALFTVELLRAMQERGDLVLDLEEKWIPGPIIDWGNLPMRVEGVIEERINRLKTQHREILAVASIEGEEFTAQVVAKVQDIQERMILKELSQELEKRHRLVYERGEIQVGHHILSRYQFSHALFQKYLYDDLSAGERRLLHADVATVLEELYAGGNSRIAVQLAYHYTQARKMDKALHYIIQAGHQSRYRYANQEAFDYYQLALKTATELNLEEDNICECLSAHESLGDVLTQMGRYAEALEHYEAARSLIDRESLAVEQKQHQAELCRKTANVHQRLGEYDVAREWLVKGLEYLSETTIETACIYTLLAGIYHRQGNNNEALRNCHKSVNIASEVNSREGLQCVARAYYILGAVYWRSNQYSDAEQYCRKSLQIYQKIGDIPGQARAYNNLAIIFYEQASWSQAREIYYKSLAINEKIGNIQEQGFVLNNLAEIHLDQGQLDQALDLYQRSNTIWEQIGFALPEAVTLSNLAQVYLLQGELLKARECLLNSQAIFAEINCEDYLAELERRWGEYYLKTGDLDKALDHTRRSHELAVSQADRREEGISSRMLGEVHLARGEYQSAKIILGESLKIMQELGNDYETAKTMMSLIQLEMADETKEPSRDHLEQATQVFTRYGAQIDLERALTLANRLNQ